MEIAIFFCQFLIRFYLYFSVQHSIEYWIAAKYRKAILVVHIVQLILWVAFDDWRNVSRLPIDECSMGLPKGEMMETVSQKQHNRMGNCWMRTNSIRKWLEKRVRCGDTNTAGVMFNYTKANLRKLRRKLLSKKFQFDRKWENFKEFIDDQAVIQLKMNWEKSEISSVNGWIWYPLALYYSNGFVRNAPSKRMILTARRRISDDG